MKKILSMLIVLMLTLAYATAAMAIDISGLSYEELQELQTQVEERLAEYRRQYAIEHGNRRIDLGEEPVILYKKDKQQLEPVIERIDESAPKDTKLLWYSSDEEIVTVSSKGVLTAVDQGDAEITCVAEDDDTIFAILPVQVRLHVSKVTLPESTVTLLLSDDPETARCSLAATISPENAFCKEIIWSSDDETVATVDSNGHVQAKSLGTATIKAMSAEEGSKQAATCKVRVNQAVAGIILDHKEITLDNGKTQKLKASVLPENASQQKVTWSSTNEKVATVSSSGTVTAKGNGTCAIICSATDGSNREARCIVKVIQAVKSIKLDCKSTVYLAEGEKLKIRATVSPENATDTTVNWHSTDHRVVGLDSVDAYGVTFKAVRNGKCEIVCTAKDGSGVSKRVKVVVESSEAIEPTGYANWGTSYGTPWFSWEYKNTSHERTIDGITIRYYATDVYGNKMKGYGWSDIYYEEIINLTIKPGSSKYTPKIKAYQFEGAKRTYTAVVKVHFTNGTSVDIEPSYWYLDY